MDSDELVAQLHNLGIDMPKGTLRRWASEGLIKGPTPVGRKGTRGRFMSWPSETVKQAAAIYVIRGSYGPKKKIKSLLAVKELVDRFYSIVNEFRETEDPEVLEKFDKLYELVQSADGTKGYVYGSSEMHPLFVMYVLTLEKIRGNKPLFEPIEVVFNWNQHLICDEDGRESFKLRYDGVSFKDSVENTVSRHIGYTPEAFEKLHGRKPTDWEKEDEEGTVITFDKDTDWTNVQVDVANQQIIIKDPEKKEFRVIDLKKSGLSILSRSEWAEIEKNNL
ncbi:MAG: hypothetical protein ACXW0U_08125 [Halobacteriota archaeon]